MKAEFFGHACLKLRVGSGPAVLTDPWFSPRGAFFGSWFQFPENAPLLDAALEGVTAICVSHHHADHLDRSTLRHACERAPGLTIHVPQYQTTWFARRLSRVLPEIRSRIVEHPAYEPFPTDDGVSVFFVPEESPEYIDSAIVYTAGDSSVVDLNDARLTRDQLVRIRAMVGEVDILALQGSGASEYPINYSYAEADMRARSVEKRRAKLEHCLRIIDVLEPRRVLFFAGPPVFLDEALSRFNARSELSVFPDQLDIVRAVERDRPDIAARTVFVLPGEELDDARLWSATDLSSPRLHPYLDKDAYIADYAKRRSGIAPFEAGEVPDDVVVMAHLELLVRMSPAACRAIGGDVTFIIKGGAAERAFTVDFEHRRVFPGQSAAPLYVLTVPASCFNAVVEETATWDDVFLSFRMTFDERTDRFVAMLKTLLKYPDLELLRATQAYDAAFGTEGSDTPMIDVSCGERRFRIQRFCPHAGGDLQHHARVDDDGTITCLAHRFRFDLETGECLTASRYRLKVAPAP
jgi:UDP-MurNAc hydroxylase